MYERLKSWPFGPLLHAALEIVLDFFSNVRHKEINLLEQIYDRLRAQHPSKHESRCNRAGTTAYER